MLAKFPLIYIQNTYLPPPFSHTSSRNTRQEGNECDGDIIVYRNAFLSASIKHPISGESKFIFRYSTNITSLSAT